MRCPASKNGQCTNVWAFGIKCSGHSQGCRLRWQYIELERLGEKLQAKLCGALGIKGE